MKQATPYYLIDEKRMLPALQAIREVEQKSGAKSVLALKCFSSWCAFDFMKDYMAGTTSSSIYEAQLGYEKFAGETHGYSVAYSEAEIKKIVTICNKVIFNSVGQLQRYSHHCQHVSIGLRINPQVGYSEHALSNTTSEHSRLGARDSDLNSDIVGLLDGVMFHMNCDNYDFDNFSTQLAVIEQRFSTLFKTLRWVSLGGGVAFTYRHYPLDEFIQCLTAFSKRHNLQVYLEPGEAAVSQSTSLVVTVLDIIDNGLPTLIVDAGVETHLLDVLTYDYTPAIAGATAVAADQIDAALLAGTSVVRVCGRTCLAGDIFGHYVFDDKVSIGSQIVFTDAGGYSMVKKNFFNGINMPSICYRKMDGATRLVREFSYDDFKDGLS